MTVPYRLALKRWRQACAPVALLAIATAFAASGCGTLGPAAIRNSRLAYNEAIQVTDEQQVLRLVLHVRYGRWSDLLAVRSVTANMRFTADASAEFPIGSEKLWLENLVPLAGGVAYEENPTISYTPIQGEQFIRQLMSPLPTDLVVLLLQSARDPILTLDTLVSRANDIRNPAFLAPGTERDPRFDRFAGLLTSLLERGRAEIVQESTEGDFSLLVDTREDDPVVAEFFDLLSLPRPLPGSATTLIPIRVAAAGHGETGIHLATRSVWDLIQILAAAADVPPEDIAEGRAIVRSERSPAFAPLAIRRTSSAPSDAAIAVRYRGDWYSIDDSDLHTKGYFLLIRALWSVRIADTGASAQAAPVLTVPVSR